MHEQLNFARRKYTRHSIQKHHVLRNVMFILMLILIAETYINTLSHDVCVYVRLQIRNASKDS